MQNDLNEFHAASKLKILRNSGSCISGPIIIRSINLVSLNLGNFFLIRERLSLSVQGFNKNLHQT
jgi:hypothetical protein